MTQPTGGADASLLVAVSGPDRPGVTAALFDALSGHPVAVADLEQVVIRGHLVLGAVLVPSPGTSSTDADEAAGTPGAAPVPSPGTATTDADEAAGTAGTAPVPSPRTATTDADEAAGTSPGAAPVPSPGTSSTDAEAVAGTLRRAVAPWGLAVDVRPGGAEPLARRGDRAHVTVLGSPLLPRAVAAVAGHIAALDGNIDRIDRLAAYPVTCLELQVSGVDPLLLRGVLAPAAAEEGIDLAVEPSGLQRRAKRLVVMDVDSTLVQGEVIELLAERAGVLDEVVAVTGAAMRGELDFEASLRRRVALLSGLPVAEVEAVREAVVLTPGARTLVRTLKRLGYQLGIVSGGFTQVTDVLAADLGLDYALANELEVVAGRLTGGLVGAVVDRAGKADALRRFAADAGVPLTQTVAIGDGANDLDMLAAAGLGVAFNAKPVVRAAAHTAVNVPFLDAVLYLLGITREEIEAADAADGLVTPAPPLP